MNDSKAHFPIGLEIYETSRSLRRHFDRRARSLGFTQGQWRALLKLDFSPGSSQAALAELLDMQPISLARILDRMVAGGLVSLTDRRLRVGAPATVRAGAAAARA